MSKIGRVGRNQEDWWGKKKYRPTGQDDATQMRMKFHRENVRKGPTVAKISLAEMAHELTIVREENIKKKPDLEGAYHDNCLTAILAVIKALSVNEDESRDFMRRQLIKRHTAEASPDVQAVKDAFPGSEIKSVYDRS